MFLCVVAPSFFHVLRFLSVSFVCERKGAFRFGLSVAVSFIFQRFRFLKERLFAHVLRFRPVSSFRERMGVFSRPAPPSFAHVLRKIDFRPDVCEKRYRTRAILPVAPVDRKYVRMSGFDRIAKVSKIKNIKWYTVVPNTFGKAMTCRFIPANPPQPLHPPQPPIASLLRGRNC